MKWFLGWDSGVLILTDLQPVVFVGDKMEGTVNWALTLVEFCAGLELLLEVGQSDNFLMLSELRAHSTNEYLRLKIIKL